MNRSLLVRLLLVFATAACTTTEGELESAAEVCDRAADHIESCLPGLIATRPETCDASAALRSEWTLAQSCSDLLLQASDGKADGVPALKGIRVKRQGNRTHFMIPLAQTSGADRARLFDETIHKFTSRMSALNTAMIDRGIDLGGLLTGDAARQFTDNYVSTVNQLFASELDHNIETALGTTIQEPRKMSTWDRYVIPQAFIAYFSARIGASAVAGGSVAATVMIVVQPWLSLIVDHTAAKPTVVGKDYELDVAVLGAPEVAIGLGVGGGIPLRVGIGAVFGPLEQPSDVAGWGIGLSASGTAPVIGGLSGKFLTILRYPPLFLLLLGYSSGTAAELQIDGNLQRLLDLNGFLAWIDSIAS